MTRFEPWKLLAVWPLVSAIGCVSDFSPDPYKKNPNAIEEVDAGAPTVGKRDASSPTNDAKVVPPPSTDAGKKPDDTISEPDPEPDDPMPSGGSPCDLSGRWIMTEHSMSVAIGAEQISLGWHYVELEQQGATVTMKRTMMCGGSTKEAPGSPAVTMDDSPSWPAYQKYANFNGRRGSSQEGSSGCDVSFAQAALLRGVTPSAYADESVPLPTLEQEASGSTPGWEDWDEDGHPGITMTVSGLATGKLFTGVRAVGSYAGSIEGNAQTFQLGFDWTQDRLVYGTDPGDPITRSLLASDAQRSPKEDQNFAEFARLSADQATGSDDEICQAIRMLAPTLNPSANPKK